jgi:hypothetical protein
MSGVRQPASSRAAGPNARQANGRPQFDAVAKALRAEVREQFEALRAELRDELREALRAEVDELRGLLDPERLVEAVAELLREDGEGPRMLSPAEAGGRLGRSAEWVRDHREELGAVALGDGPRPRLGVPSERVAAYLASSAGSRSEDPENRSAKPIRRRRRGAGMGREADFLPIRGRSPA